VNAVDAYLLGRKLTKIAEAALADAAQGRATLPTSVRMVLVDVAEHPDSSIGEIATRTGFPQSHVSTSVARLRELGALVTASDGRDGRRTLVRVSDELRTRHARRAAVPIGPALERELDGDAAAVGEATGLLEALAQRLTPKAAVRSRGPARLARRGAR